MIIAAKIKTKKALFLSHPMIGTCFLRVNLLRSSWLYLPLPGVDEESPESMWSLLEERSSWDSVRGRAEEEEEEDEDEADRDSGTVSRFPGRL